METDLNLLTKKCLQILDEPILDNLNIVYNSSNSKLFLWNKYQIFVYRDTELECLEKIFISEFQIHHLVVSNNHLLCLDKNGNVHVTSLKFKSSSQKKLKIPSQPRDHGIKVCVHYKEDHTLSLKHEAETYFLSLHRMNTDYKLEKKVILLSNNEHWPLGQYSNDKTLLTYCSINKDSFERINKIFKSEETFRTDHDLIVISLDKLNIYACLFSAKSSDDEIVLVKLYGSPVDICNIEIVDCEELNLLIGLKMGTVLRLTLSDVSKTPDIVHLNTALYKMISLKDALIYSDGNTMWKVENTFSDVKLTQFFVKNTYDILKCGDQIVCTTFNKLIYKFSTEDINAYLISKTDEYCSAETLLNNSIYLNKLFEEIDKNNELVKKLEKEEHFITALALSKRQDIVNNAIKCSVTVFEAYEKVTTKEYTLTEDIKEYLTLDAWLFLISITNTSVYDTLNNIFSHLLENIKIYITFYTEYKKLKITCIKIVEPLKISNYLVPLVTNETEVNLNIKIVINVPGALDHKKALTVLYRKDIQLTSEHFISTNQKAVNSLKKTPSSTEELIKKISVTQYGCIFNFTNVTNLVKQLEYSYYVKLPKDYELIFKTFNGPATIQQLSMDDFLKSKKDIIFLIGIDILKVRLYNDGISSPLLNVTSTNASNALNLRNFFASLVYKDYEDNEPGKEFIGYSFYTTTENFQKAVRSITQSAVSEDVLPLMEKFEKNIVGNLPL